MTCVDHVARRGEMRYTYKILVIKSEGKLPLGRPSRRYDDIKWILKNYGMGVWTGFIWLWIRTSSGLL
jgi:hypothetical protein